jgi:hypothetical protein
MMLPLHQVVAIAMRLALLCTTHGVANAIADALSPLLERLARAPAAKALVAVVVVALIVTDLHH